MSGDKTTAPPPSLRLFSAGLRFVAPTAAFLMNLFPLMAPATNKQEAIRTAWGIFRDHTYDEESGHYHLMGLIIFPFHVGVVDCTDFLKVLAGAASDGEPQKPERQLRKQKGNVIELFPSDPPPKKRGKKHKGPPKKTPPKK